MHSMVTLILIPMVHIGMNKQGADPYQAAAMQAENFANSKENQQEASLTYNACKCDHPVYISMSDAIPTAGMTSHCLAYPQNNLLERPKKSVDTDITVHSSVKPRSL